MKDLFFLIVPTRGGFGDLGEMLVVCTWTVYFSVASAAFEIRPCTLYSEAKCLLGRFLVPVCRDATVSCRRQGDRGANDPVA